MIESGTGNLLRAQVDALVNTVNTVGVMGKGVALQFKSAFPQNYKAYRDACSRGEVQLGRMFVWDSGRLGPQRYVINFPTKGHWRSKSRLQDIERGLQDLSRVAGELELDSIALPALGCGNGGLQWSDVLPLIERQFADSPLRVLVFPPAAAPKAREMPIATERPHMTYGRAALLALTASYARAAAAQRFDEVTAGASLLEIQKLMYLLQSTGQPLRLRYAKGIYGPYAENLNQVLQMLEGHYVRGYGDRSRAVLQLDPIELMPGAEEEAVAWLQHDPQLQDDIDRVLRLVQDWEGPYGLELLATVHFAAGVDAAVAVDPSRAAAYVHAWNARKQSTFPTQHVEKAWARLAEQGWLTTD